MPQCDGCGSHVSDRYAQVFRADDGTLPKCINCEGMACYSREINAGGFNR